MDKFLKVFSTVLNAASAIVKFLPSKAGAIVAWILALLQAIYTALQNIPF